MTAIWDKIERKSLDEITGLSRQRRWQLRQKEAGKCQYCGRRKTDTARCKACAQKKRKAA